MPKILKMAKQGKHAEHNGNRTSSPRSPARVINILSNDPEENSFAMRKVGRWISLADAALSEDYKHRKRA